jgi:hypothetical protein
MRAQRIAIVLLLGLAVGSGGPSHAGRRQAAPPSDREKAVKKAQELLDQHLAGLKATRGQVLPVTDDAVARLFRAEIIFAVRFRLYPVAVQPPPPLRPQNLFVVRPDGGIRHLKNTGELEAFFRSALDPVRDEKQAKAAVQAWLRLSQEFVQDGFYKFAIPEEALAVAPEQEGLKASGKLLVRGGGTGETAAVLTFDRSGRLAHASETGKVMPGVRPICQATKLLDRDPIVRRMAEQDLLVMGRAAGDYLAAQRARANPRLRRAIDRIWRRIVEEGW